MRLVILTQYYPPETGAPQARLSDLASRLRRRGHEVHVLTAMPNYPTGRVFDGWRGRLFSREVIDGNPVTRVPLFTTPSKRVALRLLNFGSFAVTSAVLGLVALDKADVLLWECPPLFLSPTAWLLARRLGAVLVTNVSDLWVQSAVDLGAVSNKKVIAALEKWEELTYRASSLVTCQSEGILAGVQERCPSARTLLYPNGVDLSRFRKVARNLAVRAEFGIPEGAFVVGYAGNFGVAQAMHQVVEAARLLQGRSDCFFLLLGSGPCRPEVERMAQGLRNVRFHDPVPSHRIPEILANFDVGVVPLARAPVLRGARPSKMFELFAAEVPFVFCGEGEGASVAQASGGALVVPPEAPSGLASAILELLDAGPERRQAMGRQAREYAERNFDRAVIAQRVEDALMGLVEERCGRRY